MTSYFEWIRNLLEHPLKVCIVALALAFASLLAEGSLLNLWNLKSEKQKLLDKYQITSQKNSQLKGKILKAQSSDKFIGHEARERLDLISEDELVFIFDN